MTTSTCLPLYVEMGGDKTVYETQIRSTKLKKLDAKVIDSRNPSRPPAYENRNAHVQTQKKVDAGVVGGYKPRQ